MKKNNEILPVVKWVGGKRQVITYINNFWPKSFDTYYEPFIGGGAVLLKFQPRKAIINDLNSELMNLYRVLKSKSQTNKLKEYLLLLERINYIKNTNNAKESPIYKILAEMDRPNSSKMNLDSISKELRAARLIFLNKNSFNGIYRVNSEGLYNVPSKHSPTKTFEEKNLNNVSNYLRTNEIKVRNVDFEKSLKGIKKGDFVYFDPPYDSDNDQIFDSYDKNSFGKKGQIRLANLCKKLNKLGIKFLLSNHNTKLINDLYKDFYIHVIKINRLIGGKGSSRKPVEEVLIMNYDYKK